MPDSYQPPVGDRDPYEKYRIIEIQKNKETPADSQQKKISSPHSAFAAYVSLLFKKFLELFERTSERGLTASAEKEVLEHLISFKEILEILKTEDRSQDSPFLNNLSQLWHQLLEDMLRFRRQTTLSTQMRALLKQFQQYPENQEHSLGYYLTEYAGQKWLPFPYLEMIHRLHMQHKKNPENSSLASWTTALKELILLLKQSEE